MQCNIMEELFEVNPYSNFDDSGFELDLQGWGSNRTIFRELIDEVNPRFIIEVGTWKGATAISMGNYIKAKKLDCKILCIDTWLGSLEHWDKKDSKDKELRFRYDSLKLKNGFPQLYYQFIYNVIHSKLQDVIIPFPNTSLMASHWLKNKGIKADLIYIDGSHEEEDVYNDVTNYYGLLTSRGIIFGDDFGERYGVRKALARFIIKSDVEFETDKGIWVVRKRRKTNYFNRYCLRQKFRLYLIKNIIKRLLKIE